MSIQKKSIVTGLLVLGLLLSGAASQAQNIKERSLKFALSPVKGTAQVTGAQWFADRVKEKSQGKMNITVYPGAVLGSDVAMLSSLAGGTLDFVMIAPGVLAGHDKALGLFDLPFLFNDMKEVDAILDGPVGKKVAAKLPQKGIIGMSYGEVGFWQVNNSKHPIVKVEDFKGLKLRAQTIPMVIDIIKALGANPVPMNFAELYSA
jgi:TRAP-type transport system periplasmic protein